MFYVFICIFFFLPFSVEAETIETPYQRTDRISNPSFFVRTKNWYLLEEVEGEKSKKYYSSLEDHSDYPVKTEEVSYSSWGPYVLFNWDLEDYEKEEKVSYFYHELKKVKQLILTDFVDLSILSIKVNGKDYHTSLFYPRENDNMILSIPETSPEDLELEITCYVLQDAQKAAFRLTDPTGEYMNQEFYIAEKGISTKKVRVIDCLKKLIMEKEIKKTDRIDNLFYIEVIKQEKKYRYRERKYKYQKHRRRFWSREEKEGYRVIEVKKEEEIYQKETIELFDKIVLDGYLDIDKIVKSTTIPLKKLKFELQETCGDTILTIRYLDFHYQKKVFMMCPKYEKSKITSYIEKPFTRRIVILFTTIFLMPL